MDERAREGLEPVRAKAGPGKKRPGARARQYTSRNALPVVDLGN
jgi:hypothetical protein